jgi:hypothetical protein
MPVFELFSAPIGTSGNVLLNWSMPAASNIISYAHSYRNAAMNLAAFREQRGDITIDDGALPIVFLYRHAFELYLKAIVYRAAVLTINEKDLNQAVPRLWREHSLVRLVKMAEPVLLASIRPWLESGELHRQLVSFATKLDEIDSGSYSFRYPVTSYGNPALPTNVMLNIFVFSEAMEKMLDDVAQVCRILQDENLRSSEQMKLALHPITGAA